MNHLLGIKEVQPCPNGELRVLYDLSGGKTATLAIYSDVQQRRLKGARVSSNRRVHYKIPKLTTRLRLDRPAAAAPRVQHRHRRHRHSLRRQQRPAGASFGSACQDNVRGGQKERSV